MKWLADTEGDVTCIPRNEEKYITFTRSVLVGRVEKEDGKEVNIYSVVTFVDMFNFMQSSVAKLAGNMRKTDFKHTLKYFENNSAMLRKCVYPYKYMTDVSKFKETKLPSNKDFEKILNSGMIVGSGNKLQAEPISDEDYSHAQDVFKTFKCQNLGEYTGLYCKSDVLILADIWESLCLYEKIPTRPFALHNCSGSCNGRYVEDDRG